MPALANPKHEAFCQQRLAGKSQSEAYRLAGYKPDPGAAARLSKNVKVQGRLKELHVAALHKVEVTVESITAELDGAIQHAIKWKAAAALTNAIIAKAKLHGLMVDRQTVNVTHNYAMMSEEELRFEIAALTAEARSLKPGVQH